MEIFQYVFLLIFSNRSMYMNLITGRNMPDLVKDTVYRFMKMIQINWIRFTTILSARIIRDAILPLDSEDRANVLVIDDSMFERNRLKKVLYGKEKYLRGHEREIIFFEAAAQALKAVGIGDKLPDLSKLREEYSRLSEEKDRLYAEYGSLENICGSTMLSNRTSTAFPQS